MLQKLGNLSVEEIIQQNIAQTLKPIWDGKAETAKKEIYRLNIIFNFAAAAGYDVDLNAIVKAKALHGKQRYQTQRTLALSWSAVPEFYNSLSEPTIVHLTLKHLILMGVRSYAVRHAQIDQFEGRRWVVHSQNMKEQVHQVSEFRVQLSLEAQAIIKLVSQFEINGYLFVEVRKWVISDTSMSRIMERRGMIKRSHGTDRAYARG